LVEFKIIDVVPMIDITREGRFIKKYRVRFKVGEVEDFIDVPEEEFEVERVKELVAKRAEVIEKLIKG